MFKSYFLFGLFMSLISSIGAAIYASSYYSFMADFSSILPLWKIFVAFISLGLIVSGVYFVINKVFPKYGLLLFNITFALSTLISILFPIIKDNFPESLEMTEFYPGFVIPLHFIFPLFWFAFSPIILKKK